MNLTLHLILSTRRRKGDSRDALEERATRYFQEQGLSYLEAGTAAVRAVRELIETEPAPLSASPDTRRLR